MKTAEDFLLCVKNIDTVGILKILPDDKKSKVYINYFYSQCKAIKGAIDRYGIPDKDKFVLSKAAMLGKEYTEITIPIFKGYDTINNIKDAYLLLRFFPDDWNIVNQISTYEIVQNNINTHLVKFPEITNPGKK